MKDGNFEMIIFGGFNQEMKTNQILIYSFKTKAWKKLMVKG